MTKRKSVDQRIAGYSKSERADAKFLLLASLPLVAALLGRELGWSPRGFLWHATLWLGLAWVAFVGGFGLVGYFRAIRRSTHRKK